MKAHTRLRSVFGLLAIGACLCVLAVPALAGAAPAGFHELGHPALPLPAASASVSSAPHPHGRPAAYSGTQYTLPAAFTTDTQSTGTPAAGSQAPSVLVREVHTVTSANDHTLAIVLSSAALGIALCGTAYAAVRTTRLKRGMVNS